MRPIFLIARRELSAYLRSLSGYVIIAALLFISGLLFNAFALGNGEKRSSEVLSAFFYFSFGTTTVAAILLSARLLAEERQSGTISLLYSSPVRDAEIVIGKFLAAIGFLAIATLVSIYMPLLVMVNGKISWGHIAAGYFGLLLVGSAVTAIGTFGSSLARNVVVAAIINACIVVALLVTWMLAKVTDRPLTDIFTAMALYNEHFVPFQSGIVHLRDVVYYLAVTYLALFGATRVLEARRWR